jgi:uncharacterized membrane protein YdjX (TVP38/TMEM64 family)
LTLFEYLAIAFGLLYSVAALRILGGVPSALDASRRYWVHGGMCLLVLGAIAASFWAFWSYRQVEAWTFPRFLLALTLPGLMYFMAAVLVPENPEKVTSWRDHYFQVRVRFFIGLALWAASAAANATVGLAMPLAHPARAVHVSALLIGCLGASSSKEAVHKGIAGVSLAVLVLWALSIGLLPGSLAS